MESIAQALWGDSSYWYLIADANGIQSDSQLFTGENLTIPTLESNDQNTASTNSVYNETQALGNVSPTHPPPASHSGCGIIGEIIIAVIAVVVAVFTAGAALAVLAPVLTGGTILGGVTALAAGAADLGTALVAGAIGGAVGSIVSQGVALAAGIQSKFNWASVAEGAIGGAVSAGLGPNLATGAQGAFGGLGLDSFGTGLLQGVAGSVVGQGIDVATGLQSKFNWADVAEAGVSDGVGSVIEANSSFLGPNVTPSSTEAVFAAGMAGAIAGAATKTALGDGSFGDNFAQAIPDAIGQTIGAAYANAEINSQPAGSSTTDPWSAIEAAAASGGGPDENLLGPPDQSWVPIPIPRPETMPDGSPIPVPIPRPDDLSGPTMPTLEQLTNILYHEDGELSSFDMNTVTNENLNDLATAQGRANISIANNAELQDAETQVGYVIINRADFGYDWGNGSGTGTASDQLSSAEQSAVQTVGTPDYIAYQNAQAAAQAALSNSVPDLTEGSPYFNNRGSDSTGYNSNVDSSVLLQYGPFTNASGPSQYIDIYGDDDGSNSEALQDMQIQNSLRSSTGLRPYTIPNTPQKTTRPGG